MPMLRKTPEIVESYRKERANCKSMISHYQNLIDILKTEVEDIDKKIKQSEEWEKWKTKKYNGKM
jgi:uncharacterized iron-regulated protein